MLREDECEILSMAILQWQGKKGKVHSEQATEIQGEGGVYRYSSSLYLTSALDTVVINAKPRSLYPRERNSLPTV
jgi:hypothetical protein